MPLETPAQVLVPTASSKKRNAVHDDNPGSAGEALASPGAKRQRTSGPIPQPYPSDHLFTEEGSTPQDSTSMANVAAGIVSSGRHHQTGEIGHGVIALPV